MAVVLSNKELNEELIKSHIGDFPQGAQLPTACTQGEAPGIAPKGKVPAINFEAIFQSIWSDI